MVSKVRLVLGAAVALVVLVDLATGQGPPIYTSYLAAQQNYQAPPPPMRPVAFVNRADYDSKSMEKNYEKAVELGKGELAKEPQKHKFVDTSDKSKFIKHESKENEKKSFGGPENGPKRSYNYMDEIPDIKYEESTQAPGMLSSLSNSMSGAWSRISSLGRSTRSVKNDAKSTNNGLNKSADPEIKGDNKSDSKSDSSARSLDDYEYMNRANGYIYFKVPKHLVCGY